MMKSNALHYECSGSGDDVLLIHGWGSSSRMWASTMKVLAHHVRLWAIDLSGFGLSSPTQGESSIDRHAAEVIDFCQLHNVKPKAIIGHSMGGMVTLKAALAKPELAERLVLVCPYVAGHLGFRGLYPFFRRLKTNGFINRLEVGEKIARSEAVGNLMLTLRFRGQQTIGQQIVGDLQRMDWQTGIHDLRSMAHTQMGDGLTKIQQPTLVVVGGRDTTVSPHEGRRLAEKLPNAHLIEFPQARHRVMDEELMQFCELLRPFLISETPPQDVKAVL
ncbi:MAG: alpha/beta hydrolase [Chitinophagaceae bacterium]|nr:alpha/beta hydrolase [Anaerolineae bacterium]